MYGVMIWYQVFTNMKNRYRILTRVKNRYQFLAFVKICIKSSHVKKCIKTHTSEELQILTYVEKLVPNYHTRAADT